MNSPLRAIQVAFTVVLLGFAPVGTNSFAKDTNVADFGAASDGKTLATSALQKAIDQCANTGGGRVNVPAAI